MPKSRPPYPEEFRREALELLKLTGKPVSQVAKDLGVSEQTLFNWRRQGQVDEGKREGLSTEERDEVKKVARELLDRLRALLVLDWRKRSSARAQIRLAIEDTLDDGLPRTYTKELYNTKCEALFEHVYESYQGDGGSVYAQAG